MVVFIFELYFKIIFRGRVWYNIVGKKLKILIVMYYKFFFFNK